MLKFAIFGAGGFGRQVLPVMRQQLQLIKAQPWELVFVDDNPPAPTMNGHRVLTYAQWLAEPADSRHISLAKLPNGAVREKLIARCVADGVAFFEVRAANVVVLDEVQIGPGAVLYQFVTLTCNIRIGQHFHANSYSNVAHDCVIGDFVTFAPSVRCSGNVFGGRPCQHWRRCHSAPGQPRQSVGDWPRRRGGYGRGGHQKCGARNHRGGQPGSDDGKEIRR
jgi:acetyltransferase-like isoleucine patch superfamily enzyme